MRPTKNTTTRSSLPFRPRVLWSVIKAADLVPMTIIFVALFVASSVILSLCEPKLSHVMDAAWFLYTVISTVGLGDYTCDTLLGRTCCILLSSYSILYIALVTGAIVSFCNQRLQARDTDTLTHFLDELEHVHEMSHEELVALSKRVKKMR